MYYDFTNEIVSMFLGELYTGPCKVQNLRGPAGLASLVISGPTVPVHRSEIEVVVIFNPE